MSGILFSIITILIIVIDQISKFLAVKYLMPISTFPIIQDVLHLTYAENKGAAFGILQNHRWVFMISSVVLMAVLVLIMVKYKKFLHPFR